MIEDFVRDEEAEPIQQKELKWYDCRRRLPDECKCYAVRLTNGCYVTELRTPCLKEKEDSSFAWMKRIVSHWCELPNPYFPYGNGEDGWTRYEMPHGDSPVIDGEKRHFFVTLIDGTVEVRLYWKDGNYFASDYPFNEDKARRVIAWMPMETFEEQEAKRANCKICGEKLLSTGECSNVLCENADDSSLAKMWHRGL